MKLISNLLLLLLLVTMTTYTLGAKELEGVIFHFRAHHEASIPVIYHTFNTVYSIDLYETNFHLIYKDIAKNGLTELYKNEPDCLLLYGRPHQI